MMKQIQAAEVIENLTPIGVIPKNEAQARPLAKLPADADDLLAVIAEQVEKERREKQAESQLKQGQPMRQKIDTQEDRNESRTQAKAAELFNTNRTIF
jgi:hypothetical protein